MRRRTALALSLALLATGTASAGLPRATSDRPDDVAGPQIHVVYAVPADGVDRGLDTDGTLERSVAGWNDWLASQTGGRALRLDTAGGALDITFVRLPHTDAQIEATHQFVRDELERELHALGFDVFGKLYAVYYDGHSDFSCGGGAWPPVLPGNVAALYLHGLPGGAVPCDTNPWGGVGNPHYLEFSMIHELLHTLGFVAPCAPHQTRAGHVSDAANDLMYAGDAPWSLPATLDVGRDDYFDAHVAGCLDLADSPYLTTVAAAAQAPAAPAGSSLALVDPARGAVVANVPLGAEPSRVAYAAGAFWVVAPESRELIRVDAATHAVRRATLGKEPYDVAVGGGAAWVTDHDGDVLLRFDPASGAVRSSRGLGSPAISVAYGAGAAWALLADGRLLRVDPRTLAVTATVPQVAYPREGAQPHLAFDRGALWVADPVAGQLVRVDPLRRRVVARVRAGGYGIAFTRGARWLADGTGSLLRLGAPAPARVAVGPLPWDVAAGAGSVWTVTRSEGTLVRVDPQRRRVLARIPLAHRAAALAFGGGLVAVALQD